MFATIRVTAVVVLLACLSALALACPPGLNARYSRPYGSVTVVQSAPMLLQTPPMTVAVSTATRIKGGDKRRARRLAKHGHNVQLNQ